MPDRVAAPVATKTAPTAAEQEIVELQGKLHTLRQNKLAHAKAKQFKKAGQAQKEMDKLEAGLAKKQAALAKQSKKPPPKKTGKGPPPKKPRVPAPAGERSSVPSPVAAAPAPCPMKKAKKKQPPKKPLTLAPELQTPPKAKVSELKRQARETGATVQQLDEADDADDVRGALIALVDSLKADWPSPLLRLDIQTNKVAAMKAELAAQIASAQSTADVSAAQAAVDRAAAAEAAATKAAAEAAMAMQASRGMSASEKRAAEARARQAEAEAAKKVQLLEETMAAQETAHASQLAASQAEAEARVKTLEAERTAMPTGRSSSAVVENTERMTQQTMTKMKEVHASQMAVLQVALTAKAEAAETEHLLEQKMAVKAARYDALNQASANDSSAAQITELAQQVAEAEAEVAASIRVHEENVKAMEAAHASQLVMAEQKAEALREAEKLQDKIDRSLPELKLGPPFQRETAAPSQTRAKPKQKAASPKIDMKSQTGDAKYAKARSDLAEASAQMLKVNIMDSDAWSAKLVDAARDCTATDGGVGSQNDEQSWDWVVRFVIPGPVLLAANALSADARELLILGDSTSSERSLAVMPPGLLNPLLPDRDYNLLHWICLSCVQGHDDDDEVELLQKLLDAGVQLDTHVRTRSGGTSGLDEPDRGKTARELLKVDPTSMELYGKHHTEMMDLLDKFDAARIASVWRDADRDGDGSLDLEEIKVVFDQLGLRYTAKEAETAYSKIDLDHDGEISYGEFAEWYKAKFAVERVDSPAVRRKRNVTMHLQKAQQKGGGRARRNSLLPAGKTKQTGGGSGRSRALEARLEAVHWSSDSDSD